MVRDIENAVSDMAGLLMREKTDAGYDIEIPSLGVVIKGDRKLLTYNPQKKETSEDYKK